MQAWPPPSAPRGRRASFPVSTSTWAPPLPAWPQDLAPTVRVDRACLSLCLPSPRRSCGQNPLSLTLPEPQFCRAYLSLGVRGPPRLPSVLPWTCHVTGPEGTCVLGVPCPLGQCREEEAVSQCPHFEAPSSGAGVRGLFLATLTTRPPPTRTPAKRPEFSPPATTVAELFWAAV